jgi:DNA-binding transcriptional regulator YdaS (Cro superfamily)
MKLSEFLSERGQGSLMAKALGVPQELVSQWRTGVRPVPLERCVDIERLTEGKVTRRDLRPDDWERIWPELAAKPAPQASPSPTDQAAA